MVAGGVPRGDEGGRSSGARTSRVHLASALASRSFLAEPIKSCHAGSAFVSFPSEIILAFASSEYLAVVAFGLIGRERVVISRSVLAIAASRAPRG